MKQKAGIYSSIVASMGLAFIVLGFNFLLWPLELLVSITPQLLILFGTALAVSVAFVLAYIRKTKTERPRRNRIVLSILLTGTIAGVYGTVYSLVVQQPQNLSAMTESVKPVRFATYNTLFTNTRFEKPVSYLREQEVDVVVFQEIESEELQSIREQLGYEYGYISDNADSSYFGSVGIVSRLPIVEVSSVLFDEGYAVVRAEIVTAQNRRVVFYGTHIVAPFSNGKYRQGQREFKQLASMIASETLPVVVGGDLNTSIYSPKLRIFNQSTADTVKPATVERWPECSWYGYGRPLCMRIDHVYIPTAARLHGAFTSPDLGSDHRMVVVDFSL